MSKLPSEHKFLDLSDYGRSPARWIANKFKETKLLSLKIDKAKKELKWQPKLSLRETINLTINWYHGYYLKKNMSKLTESQIKYYLNK